MQQRSHVAKIGEWGNAGAGAAAGLRLGLEQHLPQFLQRAAAKQAADKQPVGAQCPSDLHQCAGQVVDAVQCEQRHGEIGTSRGEGQRLAIPDEIGDAALRLRHSHDLRRLAGECWRDQRKRGGDVQRKLELPQHRREPLAQILDGPGQQEIGIARGQGPAQASPAEGAVEDEAWRTHSDAQRPAMRAISSRSSGPRSSRSSP